jgi:hypothetical protein
MLELKFLKDWVTESSRVHKCRSIFSDKLPHSLNASPPWNPLPTVEGTDLSILIQADTNEPVLLFSKINSPRSDWPRGKALGGTRMYMFRPEGVASVVTGFVII